MTISSRWATAVAVSLLAVLPAGPAHAAARPLPETLEELVAATQDSIPLAGRVVYLDFWASWCTPCRSSLPWLAGMQSKYQEQGLQVVAVNLDSDETAARKFLAKMNAPLRVVMDPKGKLAKKYRLEVMPTSFLYGRDGKLKRRHEGFHVEDSASLETLISALLREQSPK